MCLYRRHKCLKVKTICMLNRFSLQCLCALKLLICQTVCVKQVGSLLTVNIVKVQAQSKTIQQSFGLSASLAWVGMMSAYKTDN